MSGAAGKRAFKHRKGRGDARGRESGKEEPTWNEIQRRRARRESDRGKIEGQAGCWGEGLLGRWGRVSAADLRNSNSEV